jgi:hypothetical protein
MSEIRVERTPQHGPFPGELEPQRIAAYALATSDETAAVRTGAAVPAVYPAVLTFPAQHAANADVPLAAWQGAQGGVHGEHDIVLRRPLIPGEALDTWSRLAAVRTARAGTQVALHIEQFDGDGQLVVEQYWTTILLGLHRMADLGSMPADHRFPDSARNDPIGSATQHVDEQVAQRYAEVSGDWSASLRHRRGANNRVRLPVHPRPMHDGDVHTPGAGHRRGGRSRCGRPGGGTFRLTHPTGW